jgi:hypothetical protein
MPLSQRGSLRMPLKVTAFSFGLVGLFAFAAPVQAWAQEGSYQNPGSSGTTQEYVPPSGEQPTYGKKFRPNTPQTDFVLELNPLLLVQRGIAVEAEKQVGEMFSLGVDLIYRNAEVFNEKGVKANIQYLGVAPKFRVYPLATLGGVFFGVKAMIGQNMLEIKEGDISSDKSILTISPTAHVGYRFTAFSGFTLAAYIGGGVNLPEPKMEKKDLDSNRKDDPVWADAREKANDANGLFRPDFGLTLGIAL